MTEVQVGGMMAETTSAVARAQAVVDRPDVALFFNCAGRKWVLGSDAATEADMLVAALPDTPVCGFYGYGEVGRATPDASTPYHNETCVAVFLRGR